MTISGDYSDFFAEGGAGRPAFPVVEVELFRERERREEERPEEDCA